MPINPDAVGSKSEPTRRRWDSKDSLIYALGVGAGAADPLQELQLTTENTSDTPQRALPTMAVVIGPLGGGWDKIGTFNPAMLVHGEQGITLHREIPVEGELEAVSEIVGIYDKGKGAVIVSESHATLVDSGEPLFSTRMSAFIRGEGGWGGDRGPSGGQNQAPERAPDSEVTVQPRADQALIYRLSGDRNPLHSDPAFAAMGGFDRPILHGLCTYGITCKAAVDAVLGGDVSRVGGLRARFAGPVFPGETIEVSLWDEGERIALAARCLERDTVVLSHGTLDRRGG